VAQALAICDRAYVLEAGRLVRAGAARDLAQDTTIRQAFLGPDAIDSD
jgi:branched-chain amino acid transport system ATP-binding protein